MVDSGARTLLPGKPGITMAELKCLLAVLSLSEEVGRAATSQIAHELQVKPPTVCRLLDRLLAARLIMKEPYGKVELTLQGKRVACRFRSRLAGIQTAIIHQLHLNEHEAMQTAMFLVCNLDENAQKQMMGSACTAPEDTRLQEVTL